MEINQLFVQAKNATTAIAMADENIKNKILQEIAQSLVENSAFIFSENQKDLNKMEDSDLKKDRLLLNSERLLSIAASILKVVNLPDPAGKIEVNKTLHNGLLLQKIYIPMGVVGVIYESRPNVTIDVSVLNIKAGNVTILRGSSDAYSTNTALLEIIQDVLEKNGLPKNVVQLMPTQRDLVKHLLKAKDFVDMIIPRGSQSLIDFVRENAKVPVIETGAGVCHTYIEKSANIEMGVSIVANAKIQRPSVCNALDTILVDEEILNSFLTQIIPVFIKEKMVIYADAPSFSFLKEEQYPYLNLANESDFGKEFLSLQCSIKTVKNHDEAIKHIHQYSSKHSECIVTEDENLAEYFLKIVDAAAVYHNASTRFTDGEEFDLGAEIGISTQKLHARGPFALEKLVTEKWVVRGNGQIR